MVRSSMPYQKRKWLDQASEQLNQRFWMGVTDRALALETSWPIKPTKTQRIIYSERAIQWIPLGKSASTPQSQIKPPKGLEKADRLESPQTREPAWSEPNRANQGRLRVERSHLRRRRRGYPATGAAEVSRRSTKLLEGSGNESRARAGERRSGALRRGEWRPGSTGRDTTRTSSRAGEVGRKLKRISLLIWAQVWIEFISWRQLLCLHVGLVGPIGSVHWKPWPAYTVFIDTGNKYIIFSTVIHD
jgi:hypothetical protein